MRNILILFFSAMAVSLVILILFFSLFFKNFDDVITFDTKIPESAPELKGYYDNGKPPVDSKANGVARSTINVPPDMRDQAAAKDPVVGAGVNPGEEEALENAPLETGATDPEVLQPNERSEEAPTLREETAQPPKKEKKTPEPDAVMPKLTPVVPKATTPSKQEPVKETGSVPSPKPTLPNSGGTYQVYLDGFSSPEAAQSSLATLKAQGQNPLIKQKNGKTVIQLGTFSNKDYADSLAGRTGAKVKATTP